MRGTKVKALRQLAYVEVHKGFSRVERPPVSSRQVFTNDVRYLYQEFKGRRAFSKRRF